MTRLSPDTLMKSDIKRYLSKYSDFSFELKVLKKFIDFNFECKHSGTYADPITSKSREFDIRALIQKEFFRVHLSVECKNIRKNFPLLVHCLKRKENESYNELIHTFKPKTGTQLIGSISLPLPSAFIEFSRSVIVQNHCLYKKEQFVAKSVDQIGKRQDNNEITSHDSEVFEKISQAINSSIDLISEAHYLDTDVSNFYLTLVCPVLIIPDLSLWQVKYSDDGSQIGEPEQIKHISYYIGKSWTVDDNLNPLKYKLSHVEIVTYSELDNFIIEYLGGYINLCNDVINKGGKLL